MSENPIAISSLNDFIFCPVSIYFHTLENEENILFQNTSQINGSYSHRNSLQYIQQKRIYCREFRFIAKNTIYAEK